MNDCKNTNTQVHDTAKATTFALNELYSQITQRADAAHSFDAYLKIQQINDTMNVHDESPIITGTPHNTGMFGSIFKTGFALLINKSDVCLNVFTPHTSSFMTLPVKPSNNHDKFVFQQAWLNIIQEFTKPDVIDNSSQYEIHGQLKTMLDNYGFMDKRSSTDRTCSIAQSMSNFPGKLENMEWHIFYDVRFPCHILMYAGDTHVHIVNSACGLDFNIAWYNSHQQQYNVYTGFLSQYDKNTPQQYKVYADIYQPLIRYVINAWHHQYADIRFLDFYKRLVHHADFPHYATVEWSEDTTVAVQQSIINALKIHPAMRDQQSTKALADTIMQHIQRLTLLKDVQIESDWDDEELSTEDTNKFVYAS